MDGIGKEKKGCQSNPNVNGYPMITTSKYKPEKRISKEKKEGIKKAIIEVCSKNPIKSYTWRMLAIEVEKILKEYVMPCSVCSPIKSLLSKNILKNVGKNYCQVTGYTARYVQIDNADANGQTKLF